MDENLLETLYFGDYAPNDSSPNSKEYDKLSNHISELQKVLYKHLPSEYHSVLDAYEDTFSQLCDWFGKDSYSEGIKFATNFLFLALRSDK